MSEPKQLDAGRSKQASGVLLYLVEELSDARLRCSQLKKYVHDAVQLIDKSPQRDHLFEVAAHLIHGIPDTLFKLDKALDAAALGASRLDYEEIKSGLRPDKVRELENVLDDVRLRYLERRSEGSMAEDTQSKEAAAPDYYRDVAKVQRTLIFDLINPLRNMSKEEGCASQADIQSLLSAARKVQDTLTNMGHTQYHTASNEKQGAFRYVDRSIIQNKELGSGVPVESFIAALNQAGENLYVCRGGNDAAWDALGDAVTGYVARIGPLAGMPNSILVKARAVKDAMYKLRFEMGDVASALEGLAREVKRTQPEEDRYDLRSANEYGITAEDEVTSRYEEGKPADPTENMDADDAFKWKSNTEEHKDKFKAANTVAEQALQSRFEEGKPADPTENMSPEDAAEWKRQHAENKDQFKKEASGKDEISKAMSEVMEAIERKLGRAKIQAAFESDEATLGKLPDLKHIQNLLVHAVADAVADTRMEAKFGPHPQNTQFKRGPGGQLGLHGLTISPEAAEWFWDQTDAVQFSIARKVLEATAKRLGVDFDRTKTVYASEEDVVSRFEEGKPADPTENMSPEDAAEWKRQHAENKDQFKKEGSSEEEVVSRFEKGKPADPTENMSPEDAAEWKRQHAENKDQFKKEASAYAAKFRPIVKELKDIRRQIGYGVNLEAAVQSAQEVLEKAGKAISPLLKDDVERLEKTVAQNEKMEAELGKDVVQRANQEANALLSRRHTEISRWKELLNPPKDVFRLDVLMGVLIPWLEEEYVW